MRKIVGMIVMVAVLMVVSTNGFVSAATSGVCGENLMYTLDDNGLLTISGTGAMYDDTGIFKHKGIKKVIVEEGVTTIGEFEFMLDETIEEVVLPQGLTTIGKSAFNTSKIKSIALPKTVTHIGNLAFFQCDYLTDVYYTGSEADWDKIDIGESNDRWLTKDIIHFNCASETFECNLCGEEIEKKDVFIVCPDCLQYIVYSDDKTETECPYCGEFFEDDGTVEYCPYCDESLYGEYEETDEEYEDEYYEEVQFITSDWATEEVYAAYQSNLIPEEMFYDNLCDNINREEFAAIAVKLYENMIGEVPYVNIFDIPFMDCNYESEYISYIATAYKLGITKGTTPSTFSPYDNISREQLATMLYRIVKKANIEGISNFDVNNVRKFYDDSEISDYAKESVYFMAENGIVKGVDGAHFAPLDTASKEQAILISCRCANNF